MARAGGLLLPSIMFTTTALLILSLLSILARAGPISTSVLRHQDELQTTPQADELAVRDVNVHHYALVCGDRLATNFCQEQQYGYYCNSAGTVKSGGPKGFKLCDEFCECIRTGSLPPICNIAIAGCLEVDGNGKTVFLNESFDLSKVSRKDHADSENAKAALGPDEIRPTPTQPRDLESVQNNFALVCDDRDTTDLCAGDPFFYFCSTNGKVTRRGGQYYKICASQCYCQNIQSFPCIINHLQICELELPSGEHMNISNPTMEASVAMTAGDSDVASAIAPTAGTSILERRYNYAKFCGLQVITEEFSQKTYHCDSYGAITRKNSSPDDLSCNIICNCVDRNPSQLGEITIGICASPKYWTACLKKADDGILAFDLEGALTANVNMRQETSDEDNDLVTTTKFLSLTAPHFSSTENRHNFAMLCRGHDTTEERNKKQYCDAKEKAQRKDSHASDRFCWFNGCECICLNTDPKPLMAELYLNLQYACDDLRKVGGNLLKIEPPDDMTLHATSSSPSSNTSTALLDKRHDWALFCGNRGQTEYCNWHGYYCDSRGQVQREAGWKADKLCWFEECTCANINTTPKPPKVGVCILDALACFKETDEGFLYVGPPSNATSNYMSTALSQSTSTPSLEKRHDYAMDCLNRVKTDYCNGKGYFCNQSGKVIRRSDYAEDSYCWAACKCVNTKQTPQKPAVGLCWAEFNACFLALKEDVYYVGPPSNATANFTTTALGFEATSLPMAPATISPSSLEKRHDYALDCQSREMTSDCAQRGYICNTQGRVQLRSDKRPYKPCSSDCKCTNINPPVKPPAVGLCWTTFNACFRVVQNASMVFVGPPSNETMDFLNATVVPTSNGTQFLLARPPDNRAAGLLNTTFDLASIPSLTQALTSLEKRHNYYMDCGGREVTETCTKAGNYCDESGNQVRKPDSTFLVECLYCYCRSLHPNPKPPAIPLCWTEFNACFLVQNASKVLFVGPPSTQTSDILNMTLRTSISVVTPTSTPASLDKRHDYFLDCGDRSLTAGCGSSHGLFCNSLGNVERKAGYDFEVECLSCRCGSINSNPKPPAIGLCWPEFNACFKTSESGDMVPTPWPIGDLSSSFVFTTWGASAAATATPGSLPG